MRLDLRAGWPRWCAAILLALLAVSMLHAAVPHNAAQRDCYACKALSAPSLTHPAGILPLPVPPSSVLAAGTTDQPLSAILLRLRPLRGPPAPAPI